MRRIYSFLIILLMMSAIPAFAQKGGVIKSRIVSTDNTPLQGAIVSVVGTSSSAISDENGNFELTTDQRKGTLPTVITHGSIPSKSELFPAKSFWFPITFLIMPGRPSTRFTPSVAIRVVR